MDRAAARLLLDDKHVLDSDHGPRKLIIFTEHRDTLNYQPSRSATSWVAPTRSSPSTAAPSVAIAASSARPSPTTPTCGSWWPPTPPVKVSTSRLRT